MGLYQHYTLRFDASLDTNVNISNILLRYYIRHIGPSGALDEMFYVVVPTSQHDPAIWTQFTGEVDFFAPGEIFKIEIASDVPV